MADPPNIGATRSSHIGINTELEAEWGVQILNNRKIGVAQALAKNLFLATDSIEPRLFQLIGEPEFEMWLGKPRRMEVNVRNTCPVLKNVDWDL